MEESRLENYCQSQIVTNNQKLSIKTTCQQQISHSVYWTLVPKFINDNSFIFLLKYICIQVFLVIRPILKPI